MALSLVGNVFSKRGRAALLSYFFIFYEAIGYGQGQLLTGRWAAEMMDNGIIKHRAGVADLWYLSTLHAQQN
jgi:hypothetical protein